MQRPIAMLALILFAPTVWAQATEVGMPPTPQTAQQQQNIISVGTGKYKLGYDGRGKGNYGKQTASTISGGASLTTATSSPMDIDAVGMGTAVEQNTKPMQKKLRSDSALRSDVSSKTTTTTPTATTSSTSSEKTTAPASTSSGAAVLVGGKLVPQ